MCELRLTGYSPQDRQGLAALVTDVLLEYGDAFDPVLDVDLAAPERHYRHIWLLKAAGTVVGSAAITPPDDGTTTLKRMYLRPERRGEGWGRQLLEAALREARREGCHTILLDTTDRQHAARRLYDRAGFRLITEHEGVVHYAQTLSSPGVRR
jgi:GNAT superfamily N-acetyltransferase